MVAVLEQFDKASVQQFLADIGSHQLGCNGEGNTCSCIDEQITCQFNVSNTLLMAVLEWTSRVHKGQIEFDPALEHGFRKQIRVAIDASARLVEVGFQTEGRCFHLTDLESLHTVLCKLNVLDDGWVRPQRSVAPGPRANRSNEKKRKMRERLKSLRTPEAAT